MHASQTIRIKTKLWALDIDIMANTIKTNKHACMHASQTIRIKTKLWALNKVLYKLVKKKTVYIITHFDKGNLNVVRVLRAFSF